LCCALNGPDDAHVRAATTQVWLQVLANLDFGRTPIAIKQRLRPQHHPGDTKSALGGLLVDERLLEWAWSAQTL